MKKTTYERFLVQFEERGYSDKFEFLGGKASAKGKAKLRCKICGCEFEKFGSFCQQWTNIRCDKCHAHLLDETSAPRDGLLREHIVEKYMGGMSAKQISKLFGIHERYVAEFLRESGIDPMRDYKEKVEKSRRISGKGRKHGTAKQRMEYYGLCDKPVEKIKIKELYDRDQGICHLCGKPVDFEDVRYLKSGRCVIGWMYPTIDHLVPLAMGGAHSWDNVRLAHKICNSKKGARWADA